MTLQLFFRLLLGYALLSILSGCSVDSQVFKSSQNSSTGGTLSNLLQSSVPILIQDLPNDGVVTSSNEASYQLSGFCKFNGQEISVTTEKPETKTVTCADNAWSVTLDFTPANFSALSLSDETVSVKIVSGSFLTTLGLPRKLNTTGIDLLVNWLCTGTQGCSSGSPAYTGSMNGLKATDIPVTVACTPGKTIHITAFGYQQNATTPDATVEYDVTKTCDPQGRASATVSSTNNICYTTPIQGCGDTTTCRLKIKATEDNQISDEEEVKVEQGASCA